MAGCIGCSQVLLVDLVGGPLEVCCFLLYDQASRVIFVVVVVVDLEKLFSSVWKNVGRSENMMSLFIKRQAVCFCGVCGSEGVKAS